MWPTVHKGLLKRRGRPRFSKSASPRDGRTQLYHARVSHAPLEGYSVPPSGLFWAKLSGFGPDFAQKSGFFIKIMKVRLVCID